MKFISSILLTSIFLVSPVLAGDFRGSGTFKCEKTLNSACGPDGICANDFEILGINAIAPLTYPIKYDVIYEKKVGNHRITAKLVQNVVCEFYANTEKIECVGQRSATGSTDEKLVSVSLPGIAPLGLYFSHGHAALTSNIDSAILPAGSEFNFSGLCEFGRITQGG